MPNYVRNVMYAQGEKENLEKMLETVTSDGTFDFNQIIPMPPTLLLVSGSIRNDCLAAYAKYPGISDEDAAMIERRTGKNAPCQRVEQMYRDWDGNWDELEDEQRKAEIVFDTMTPPKKDFIAYAIYGKRYVDNIKEYKAVDWYDWCTWNWGTKWNTSDNDIGDIWSSEAGRAEVRIQFDTAWAAPIPIFETLARMYPEIHFEGEYADEDIGENCGSWSIDSQNNQDGKGSVVHFSEPEDSVAFASEMWGIDPEENEEDERGEL